MIYQELIIDPFNMIITGVGGQGNVIASRIIANMLVRKELHVTVGETFGASQRGGSVMSHLRISGSSNWSPQIPKGRAHIVLALEPIEAIRVLRDYGNPGVKVLSNTRKINPVAVIAGESDYPSIDEIKKVAGEMSSEAWFIDATDEAIKLGNPVLGNIIMLGALSLMDLLPMDEESFQEVIFLNLPEEKCAINIKAFNVGRKIMQNLLD